MRPLQVILTCALNFFPSALFADTIIDIDTSSRKRESARDELVVTVMPENAKERDTTAWYHGVEPDWLKIEFSFKETDGDSFVVSEELYALFNPTYYPKIPQYGRTFERPKFKYWYTISVPEAAAGKRVCARLTVMNPPYGPIPMRNDIPQKQKYITCFNVLDATTKAERDEAIATYVNAEYDAGNFGRTVALVDSLLATGWRSEFGISFGLMSARKESNVHAELRFLDAMFETCGCIIARQRSDMPPYGSIGGGTARDTAAYQWHRERLLKLIGAEEE